MEGVPFWSLVIEEHTTCLGRAGVKCGLRIGKAARGSETPEEDCTRPRQLRPTCHVMGEAEPRTDQYNPLGPCLVGDKHWRSRSPESGSAHSTWGLWDE